MGMVNQKITAEKVVEIDAAFGEMVKTLKRLKSTSGVDMPNAYLEPALRRLRESQMHTIDGLKATTPKSG